jgi:Icc-related predicted phosphoesterase
MKVAITSDIHLEFADWYPSNPENADVLILSGDILVATELEKLQQDPQKILDHYRGERFRNFLIACKQNYKHVVYIMGNHEHYHGDFAVSANVLRKECNDIGIFFLDTECVKIEDYTFIGGTLWTDMNKRDSLTLYHMTKMMNDFRIVHNSNREVSYKTEVLMDKPVGMTDDEWMEIPQNQRVRAVFKTRIAKFSPEDAVEQHEKMVGYVKTVLQNDPNGKYVVVGHHAPSRQSTHPRYKEDTIMNGGYSSSLDEFIMDHPQIKLWTHGHTHEPFDYLIGDTRIVCNPRGYVGHERMSDKDEPYLAKVVELS